MKESFNDWYNKLDEEAIHRLGIIIDDFESVNGDKITFINDCYLENKTPKETMDAIINNYYRSII